MGSIMMQWVCIERENARCGCDVNNIKMLLISQVNAFPLRYSDIDISKNFLYWIKCRILIPLASLHRKVTFHWLWGCHFYMDCCAQQRWGQSPYQKLYKLWYASFISRSDIRVMLDQILTQSHEESLDLVVLPRLGELLEKETPVRLH